MKLTVGDLIYQKVNKFLYVVTNIYDGEVRIEYYDKDKKEECYFTIKKKTIEQSFKERASDLEHFKVKRK